jgi:hypothetical protein
MQGTQGIIFWALQTTAGVDGSPASTRSGGILRGYRRHARVLLLGSTALPLAQYVRRRDPNPAVRAVRPSSSAPKTPLGRYQLI